jgi:hypothetical protein
VADSCHDKGFQWLSFQGKETNMLSDHTTPIDRGAIWRGWAVALASGAAAVVANVVLATAATRLLDLHFQLLEPGHIAVVTAFGVAAALGVYVWVARRSAEPFLRFRRIALWALALSFIPNLSMMVNPMAAEALGATVPGVLVLMVAHLPPAAAALAAARALARAEQRS